MRWTPGGRSKDLEDDRSQGGSVGGFRRGGIKVGLGGIVVLLLLSVIFKRDFLSLIDTGTGTSYSTGETQSDPERDAAKNRWFNLSLLFWMTPKVHGARYSPPWEPVPERQTRAFQGLR